MKNVLLASVVVLLFASSAHAGLFGRNNDYVKKAELHRAIIQSQVERNMIAIQSNSDRIKYLEMAVIQNRIKAEIQSQVQTQTGTVIVQPTYRNEPIQAPVEPQPSQFYAQPYSPVQAPQIQPVPPEPRQFYGQPVKRAVYQQLHTLPPARKVYVPVQYPHRVQPVRQVR